MTEQQDTAARLAALVREARLHVEVFGPHSDERGYMAGLIDGLLAEHERLSREVERFDVMRQEMLIDLAEERARVEKYRDALGHAERRCNEQVARVEAARREAFEEAARVCDEVVAAGEPNGIGGSGWLVKSVAERIRALAAGDGGGR